MAGESIRRIVSRGDQCALTRCVCGLLGVAACLLATNAIGQTTGARYSSRVQTEVRESGTSSTEHRKAALASLPLKRLTRTAQNRILSIAQRPTIYRRLPTQSIDCDRDMFLFLTRNPEVLVGMWDLMGITEVQTERTGPYQLAASDGAGTVCTIDLVYGDPHMHLFVASGSYDGKLAPKQIRGSGVFMLTSRYAKSASNRTTVIGTIDCFLQIESLGVDLVARTFSGLIGRAADNNYIETSRFVTQVSQASERNPRSMLDVAKRIPQVAPPTRTKFQSVIREVADRAEQRYASRVRGTK